MARRSLRGRANAAPAVVALAWYDADQWAKLRQVAEDADNLDETHDAWLANAENAEREFRRRGVSVRRVPIDVDALVAWCRAGGAAVNGPARSRYAAELAAGRGSQLP